MECWEDGTWKESESVKKWLGKLKPRSRKNYASYFSRFLEFVKKSPDEIINSRYEDLGETDPREKFRWEDKVLEFQSKLTEEGLKGQARYNYVKAVMAFFGSHRGARLQFEKGNILYAGEVTRVEWIPSNAQMRQIYSQCSARDKVALLLSYHCGCESSDMETLNIQDLPIYDEEGKININEHRYAEIRRSKEERYGIVIQTCLSSELLHDIDIYLRSRSYPPKNAPLLESRGGERLSADDLSKSIKKTVKLALGEKLAEEWDMIKPRKAYQKALDETTTIPKNHNIRMMGHSLGVTGHYSKPTPLEIKTDYDMMFPKISVNGYVQARGDLKELGLTVQEVKEKLGKQETTINALIEQISKNTEERAEEIGEVKDYIKRVKQLEDMVLKLVSDRAQKS